MPSWVLAVLSARAADPMFVPPVVQSGAAEAFGPQRKNVTVPVASSGAEAPVTVTVAVSCTGVPGATVPFVDACVASAGTQRANWPRTLSCSSASPAAEERLLIRKLEKQASDSFSWVRFSPPSKRLVGAKVLLGVPACGSTHGDALAVSCASAQALSLVTWGQSEVVLPTKSGWRLQAAVKQLFVPR